VQCGFALDSASGRVSHVAPSHIQAGSLNWAATPARGTDLARVPDVTIKAKFRTQERGAQFCNQFLEVRDKDADDNSSTHLIAMMRAYTVSNLDQCENLPDTRKPMPALVKLQEKVATPAGVMLTYSPRHLWS
jgi:hypothetical protein